MDKPFQIWIIIDLNDSGQDAIYMHTKNPNSNNFPIKWQFTKPLSHTIATELVEYLERKKSFKKYYMDDMIVVVKEGFGEKLF